MPKSDDVDALYDQFNGNVNSFREIGRTARAAEAHSRWPLFSNMAQERGASVPSAGEQTPSAATQRHQDEPAPSLTPSDVKPVLPLVPLQSASEALAPDLHETVRKLSAQVPSVWEMGLRPATATTTTPPAASSVTPPPANLPEVTGYTALRREPSWQLAFSVQPTATPSVKPALLSEILSAAASQAPAPAFLPVLKASPRVGTSPLRRLVRAEPPTPDSSVSNDPQPAEDLSSVFSRLAGCPDRALGR